VRARWSREVDDRTKGTKHTDLENEATKVTRLNEADIFGAFLQ
jgi:hypothetical protein